MQTNYICQGWAVTVAFNHEPSSHVPKAKSQKPLLMAALQDFQSFFHSISRLLANRAGSRTQPGIVLKISFKQCG